MANNKNKEYIQSKYKEIKEVVEQELKDLYDTLELDNNGEPIEFEVREEFLGEELIYKVFFEKQELNQGRRVESPLDNGINTAKFLRQAVEDIVPFTKAIIGVDRVKDFEVVIEDCASYNYSGPIYVYLYLDEDLEVKDHEVYFRLYGDSEDSIVYGIYNNGGSGSGWEDVEPNKLNKFFNELIDELIEEAK